MSKLRIKFLIYSMRKALLEHSVVELVYKFKKKSSTNVLKGELISEVPFKRFGWSLTLLYYT